MFANGAMGTAFSLALVSYANVSHSPRMSTWPSMSFFFYFVAFSSHVLCLLSLMVALGHGSADLASSSAVKMVEGPPTLSFVLLSAAAKVTS